MPICVDWIVPLLQRGLASRIKMLAFKGNETQQVSIVTTAVYFKELIFAIV